MTTFIRQKSQEIRPSTTASSDNTPTHSHYHGTSFKKASHAKIFLKLKTISSNGEWIIPEKRHFHEDLNMIFSEDPEKFIGVFQTNFYKIIRKFITSNQRPEIQLYYTRMEPNSKSKAQIAIIHGFGEHSGRYLTFADYFAKRGFLVHIIDLSGFGYSGGRKCSSTLEELHQDIESLLGQCENDLPLFLMGQGFGAGLMLSFLLRNNVKLAGVITTSALIESHHLKSYNWMVRWILDSLAEDYGELCFNAKLNPTSLYKNNYNIRNYLHDPLVTPLISLKMIKTVSDVLNYVMPNAYRFNYPILLIHGAKDILTNPEDSMKFFKATKSKDKSLKFFEEGYHQLHDDNEMTSLQKYIFKWCKQRSLKTFAFNGIENKSILYGVPNRKILNKTIFMTICFAMFWCLR